MRRHGRRFLLGALLLGLGAAAPSVAHGAEWGTIVPGTSATAAVRAQFGPATRTSAGKLDGYDTTQWVYEEAQAPVGMNRMTVEFGLLTASGYRPDIVRDFRLEPKFGVFTQQTIVMGWGNPSRVGREENVPIFYYEDGLLVYFDREGWIVERMVFTPRQPRRAQ